MLFECKTCGATTQHMNKRQRKCGHDEFTVMTCKSCHNHSAKCNFCDFHNQYSGNKMQQSFRKKNECTRESVQEQL